MSLHRKIIGWFVVFAAVTVIGFGVGDYIQSQHTLRYALEARAGSVALQMAGDVERRYARAASELLALGYAAAAGATDAMPVMQNGYANVRVLRDGVPIFRADVMGPTPPALAGCGTGVVPLRLDVPFEDATGRQYRVEGQLPAEQLFALMPSAGIRLGRRGLTAVVRSTDGQVVYDPGCSIAADAEPGALAEAVARQVVARANAERGAIMMAEVDPNRSGGRLMAMVRTSVPMPWVTAASLDYAEFAAPLGKLRRQYFAVMTLILVLALGLVVAGMRRDMRRLAAIATAADAIGRGRFDVWLPPPTGDEIGRVSLALGRMTERLSSSLRQVEVSRAMAAVGEVAAHLSHEIRNPLSSIRLNLQMLRRDLRTGSVPDDGEHLIGLCLAELQRLDGAVRTVLEVGRPGPTSGGSCEAHTVIEETLRVLQREMSALGISVHTVLGATEANVAMNSAALRSIVMNLVLNSRDALVGRPAPAITVMTRLLGVHGPDPQFELRVSDSGPGVAPELQDRIFDLFFTTKSTGNGLGLPAALRAVQECGGVMRLEPSARWVSGAEFVIELPLAERAEPAAAEPPEPRTLVAAGMS
jgi:signal transduction histidine kinase